MKHRAKLTQMVVGTHGWITDPNFIQAFLGDKCVKFLMPPHTERLFHPKVYLFKMADDNYKCIIGSANFTSGGFRENDEIAVLLDFHADDNQDEIKRIVDLIKLHWDSATTVDARALELYRSIRGRKRPDLIFVPARRGKAHDNAHNILSMSWDDFFSEVKAEHIPHNMADRLVVIDAARKLFDAYPHFVEMPTKDREGIAGLSEHPDVRWFWFGKMTSRWTWFATVRRREQCRHLSDALDLIPITGDFGRETYLAYIEQYNRAWTKPGAGIGTASRLLSMKRPDTFICACGGNLPRLRKELKLPSTIDYGAYWDLIIEPLMQSPWWNSPVPDAAVEIAVWNARAAFLDAHCYEPTS